MFVGPEPGTVANAADFVDAALNNTFQHHQQQQEYAEQQQFWMEQPFALDALTMDGYDQPLGHEQQNSFAFVTPHQHTGHMGQYSVEEQSQFVDISTRHGYESIYLKIFDFFF